MGRASVPTPALYPAFFFVLEKCSKSARNAVIPTYPMHRSHGLQHLRHKRPTLAFSGENGYTLGSRRKITHNGSHGETRAFQMGRYYYPRSVPHVHQHPRAGCQNGVLCRFWVLAGCAPEERRKPSGQRCAYARRCSEGVAAPPGCVIFFASVEIGICTSGAHGFPRVRGTGGITTLGALCVLLKCRTAACQNGSFAVF